MIGGEKSPHFFGQSIDRFHMTSRRLLVHETMKRSPCWRIEKILRVFNSFLMQKNLSFVPRNLHSCLPPEWKRSILRPVSSLQRRRQHTYCFKLCLIQLLELSAFSVGRKNYFGSGFRMQECADSKLNIGHLDKYSQFLTLLLQISGHGMIYDL